MNQFKEESNAKEKINVSNAKEKTNASNVKEKSHASNVKEKTNVSNVKEKSHAKEKLKINKSKADVSLKSIGSKSSNLANKESRTQKSTTDNQSKSPTDNQGKSPSDINEKLRQIKAKVKTKKSTTKHTLFTGRRKSSIARVKLTKGDGSFLINKKYTLEKYFPLLALQYIVKKPLVILDKIKTFNVHINVKGGGISAQADAISLGISRFLDQEYPDKHKELRSHNLLTRDSRVVERKKYGRHKARRSPQFSKR